MPPRLHSPSTVKSIGKAMAQQPGCAETNTPLFVPGSALCRTSSQALYFALAPKLGKKTSERKTIDNGATAFARSSTVLFEFTGFSAALGDGWIESLNGIIRTGRRDGNVHRQNPVRGLTFICLAFGMEEFLCLQPRFLMGAVFPSDS